MIGAVVLLASYAALPDSVVLYRPPWADAPTTGPKSLVTVGRIASMGAGQLGAANAMAFASHGSLSWERFWRWLGLVAGVKTLLECAAFVTPQGTTLERTLSLSTFAVVGVFALTAAWWWRRGELGPHRSISGPSRIGLIASITLWALSAAAPRFVA